MRLRVARESAWPLGGRLWLGLGPAGRQAHLARGTDEGGARGVLATRNTATRDLGHIAPPRFRCQAGPV